MSVRTNSHCYFIGTKNAIRYKDILNAVLHVALFIGSHYLHGHHLCFIPHKVLLCPSACLWGHYFAENDQWETCPLTPDLNPNDMFRG